MIKLSYIVFRKTGSQGNQKQSVFIGIRGTQKEAEVLRDEQCYGHFTPSDFTIVPTQEKIS